MVSFLGTFQGVLSVCDTNCGIVEDILKEDLYGAVIFLDGVERRSMILNVYAPCEVRRQRRLQGELLKSHQGVGHCALCMLGDFHSICSPDERNGKGIQQGNVDIKAFNQFIYDLGVEEPTIMGRKFTWIFPDGKVMGRLDRIFTSWSGTICMGKPSNGSIMFLLVVEYLIGLMEKEVTNKHCPTFNSRDPSCR
ncbi:hypothetical protein VNO77_37245 [Canavalia gladiata]|uniref:Uncharacterized protein n=1 Tax=Canavalia gladiata TaxID=3824 RepID=A0AAN9PX12_CANGL